MERTRSDNKKSWTLNSRSTTDLPDWRDPARRGSCEPGPRTGQGPNRHRAAPATHRPSSGTTPLRDRRAVAAPARRRSARSCSSSCVDCDALVPIGVGGAPRRDSGGIGSVRLGGSVQAGRHRRRPWRGDELVRPRTPELELDCVAPTWLTNLDDWVAACDSERRTYAGILDAVASLSSHREDAKCALLAESRVRA